MYVFGYKHYMKHLIGLVLTLFITSMGMAQNTSEPKTRILFLFDASFSMVNQMGPAGSRMDVAKKLLGRMVDSLEKIDELEIALRVYGHQQSKDEYDCKDTKLEVGFSKGNHQQIKNRLNQIRPNR